MHIVSEFYAGRVSRSFLFANTHLWGLLSGVSGTSSSSWPTTYAHSQLYPWKTQDAHLVEKPRLRL